MGGPDPALTDAASPCFTCAARERCRGVRDRTPAGHLRPRTVSPSAVAAPPAAHPALATAADSGGEGSPRLARACDVPAGSSRWGPAGTLGRVTRPTHRALPARRAPPHVRPHGRRGRRRGAGPLRGASSPPPSRRWSRTSRPTASTSPSGTSRCNDLAVVSSGKGQQGVLSGQVVNSGSTPATVTISAPGGGPELTKRCARQLHGPALRRGRRCAADAAHRVRRARLAGDPQRRHPQRRQRPVSVPVLPPSCTTRPSPRRDPRRARRPAPRRSQTSSAPTPETTPSTTAGH